MVRLGALLRRSRDKDEKPEVRAPVVPTVDTPRLVVMIPDVAGVSSFRLNTFIDAPAAVRFITSLSRQQRERAHAFWALQTEPADAVDADDDSGEAMVLIRSEEGSELVYVVSFVDIESAQSFARFEVKRGMHLGLILIYWASMVNVVLSDDSVQLIPELPPRIDKRPPAAVERSAYRLASTEVTEATADESEEWRRLEAEAEEERRLEAEAEEERRLEAEAEEERRLEAEAEEERRLEAEAEEQQRLEARAEEQRRLAAEAAEQRRREAEADEQRRLAAEAEEERRLKAEAEEQRRLQAEAEEQRRLEAEAEEQRRLAAEAEGERRLQAEAEERRRLAAEAEEQRRLEAEAAEQRRLEAEAAEQRRLEAEAEEQRRLAAEAEEQRQLKAEVEEHRRLKAEAEEQRRLEEEAERWRREAEAEEQGRLQAEEEERQRRAGQEERQRLMAAAEEQHRLEEEAEERRRFEEAKRAIFAMDAENADDGLDGTEPSGKESRSNSIASSLEATNPIEELLRREAESRVQVPPAFAKNAAEGDSLEGLEDEIDGADIADEVGKILRKRRWAKRESPFEGFKSPPGRF